MSIDLQDPIAVGRSATEAVSRHASDAVDLARSIDLHAPAAAVKHARKRANRAAKHLEHQVDHASKRAAKRVRAESRHVAKADGRPSSRPQARRGPPGGRRRRGGGRGRQSSQPRRWTRPTRLPDPFGTAVHATDPLHAPDTSSVTTG